jgi:hypothetical protein
LRRSPSITLGIVHAKWRPPVVSPVIDLSYRQERPGAPARAALLLSPY